MILVSAYLLIKKYLDHIFPHKQSIMEVMTFLINISYEVFFNN
jgi:hypothetical protein